MTARTRMPVVYISHGSPIVAVRENDFTRALGQMGKDLPRPRGIVIVSAHWEAPLPIRVTGAAQPTTIYDFFGFPEELYRLTYPSPGSPDLAAEIVRRLSAAGLPATIDPRRGLDHGAWVPLLHAYPAADIPVVEVALLAPRSPELLFKLGQALAPLREQRILLLGSGGIVHNLPLLHWNDEDAPVDPWAKEFDDWIQARLETLDRQAIARYRSAAPNARLAVPTTEHFDPIFFVLGAASERDRVLDIYEGFHYGNLSMRTFALAEGHDAPVRLAPQGGIR